MSLDSLPPEVLAAVVAHLPLRTTAIRPHSSLLSLASSSRHLHAALEPLVNRTVALNSHTNAQALARDAPARHRAQVKVLHLGSSSSSSPSAATSWDIDHLEHLVHSLDSLVELHCAQLAADPRDTLDALARSGTASRLDLLDLDFAPSCPSHRPARADPSRTKYTSDPARPPSAHPRTPSCSTATRPLTRSAVSLAHALTEHGLDSPRPSSSYFGVGTGMSTLQAWLRACLAQCPELRTLALRNMPALAPRAAPPCCNGVQAGSSRSEHGASRLERLELEATELDDAALDEVLGAAGATLDTLRLRRCSGFTGAGLVRAVRAHGARIRHLEIAVGEASSVAPSSSAASSFSSSPAPSTLAHVVGDLLPHLRHLTTLKLSSPASASHAALISPAALALLPTYVPHLAALHLTGPHTASDILPLVRIAAGAPTLRHLRVLALHRPAPSLGACDSARQDDRDGDDDAAVQELWAAALQREVRLEGAQFERARTRLEWARGAAWELVRDEAAAVTGLVVSTRRRKRPSLM
ncbi:hypothetical protein JCM9279_003190 [Rhodotorula babjevae]